jgi:hypothetical protein
MEHQSIKSDPSLSIQIETSILLDQIIIIEITDSIHNQFHIYNGSYTYLFKNDHHIWKHVSFGRYLVKCNKTLFNIRGKIMWLFLSHNELTKFFKNPHIHSEDTDHIYTITEDCCPSNIPPLIPWKYPSINSGIYFIHNLFLNIIRSTDEVSNQHRIEQQKETLLKQTLNISLLHSNIKRILECGICMGPFNNTHKSPCTLHCGHSYCNACLDKITTTVLNHTAVVNPGMLHCSASSIECPECRTTTTFNETLKPSYKILDLIAECTNISTSLNLPT